MHRSVRALVAVAAIAVSITGALAVPVVAQADTDTGVAASGRTVGAPASGSSVGAPASGSTVGAAPGSSVGATPGSTVAAASTSAGLTTPAAMRAATSTQLFGAGPYRSPRSVPAQYAERLATSDPAGAAAATTIAQYPIATWLGEWAQGAQLEKTIGTAVTGAEAAGTTPVFVVYAIPNRDCGGYSAGGFDEATYDAWVDRIVTALTGHRAVVVVEPDALAMMSDERCGTGTVAQRTRILSREVRAFTAAGVAAYLDAGHSGWVKPAVMAERLRAAGVADARGFATNVSNYQTEASERAWADQVSAATGGSHYVVDTSRNGQGWRGTWCNGPGAGLGTSPRVVSDGTALDALLWVKTPGTSDGSCDGAPDAGQWYSAFAQALVANARLGTPPATHDPVHAVDAPQLAAAGLAVGGWAVDPDQPATALRVAVTVDGALRTTVTANRSRADVSGVAGAGGAHGWTATVSAAAGSHRVCAVARNVGVGADAQQCRSVTVPAAKPTARVSSVTSGAAGRISLRGWAFDRDDLRAPLTVTTTVDGAAGPRLVARIDRPEVDRVWDAGSEHGYARTFPARAGTHRVCLTAVGVGPGGDRAIGCRTVTVR